MNPKYKKIFEPIQIGHMMVKNRIEASPAAPRLASPEGLVTPELIEWSRELAKGGAGIVTVGISMVTSWYLKNSKYYVHFALITGFLLLGIYSYLGSFFLKYGNL